MPTRQDRNWSILDEALRSLGEAQLQIQVATSIGYDTQALGLMAVGAALGGVLLALQSTLEHGWWVASLVFAVLSVFVCLMSLSLASADEVGQNLRAALDDVHTAEEVKEGIVESIARAVADNKPALSRRRAATRVALGLLVISLVLAVLAKAIM